MLPFVEQQALGDQWEPTDSEPYYYQGTAFAIPTHAIATIRCPSDLQVPSTPTERLPATPIFAAIMSAMPETWAWPGPTRGT